MQEIITYENMPERVEDWAGIKPWTQVSWQVYEMFRHMSTPARQTWGGFQTQDSFDEHIVKNAKGEPVGISAKHLTFQSIKDQVFFFTGLYPFGTFPPENKEAVETALEVASIEKLGRMMRVPI